MAELESKQWRRAQQTSLWKRTLGSDDEDVKPLKESFLDARENAAVLLDKIRPDFPNLTIHDITHVDSLWSVADAIIGKNYPINPLEGYVLGIAFLIHDAALSYDAVGGKEKLRKEDVWKDAFAEGPGKLKEDDFLKECDFTAIRAIHAREAKDIMNKTFSSDDMPSFHIVKKASYRHSLGEIIGKIAASHHWSIDEIESKLDIQITPSSEIPGFWDINAQKLACILRCADAGHIDDGRAPYYIFRSLNVNGVSLEHWKYQSNLGIVQPYIKDNSKLLITSTSSFKKEDFAAWNVAYEAVKWFDEEIKKSNYLLKTIDDRLVFPRTGVMGASSKEELAKYIKTEGWQPCSIGVHSSNIKNLIETLGGSKLYGEDNMLLVALRELIQNARDAIHARQKLDESFDNGKITIRLIEEGDVRYIEVEDNGIGMSMDCIKHNLLDFGNSYWKSQLSKYENPGLKSKGFISIGKFGIGFYSVFMVAKSVEVRTKRYNKAVEDAQKVEFPKGLTLSPIISDDNTMIASVSTIVRFELKDDIELSFKLFHTSLSLQKVLSVVVTGLDADVYFEEKGIFQKIHTNIKSLDFDKKEWFGNICFPCPFKIKESVSKMEALIDENGEQRGMILPLEEKDSIYQSNDVIAIPCIQTIGGLLSSSNLIHSYGGSRPYIGYLDGIENSLARNKMILDESLKKCLQTWIREKYNNNYDKILTNTRLAEYYRTFIHFFGFSDIIIIDNLRRIYTVLRSNIDNGSLKGLMQIHRYLFMGLQSFAGLIVIKHNQEFVLSLLDSQLSGKDFSNTLKEHAIINNDSRKKIERLIDVCDITPIQYEDIIMKYYYIMNEYITLSFDKLAIEVWVNFMLYNLLGKMIDWRKVDGKQLKKAMGLGPDELGRCLKQFLSSTYLDEMTASITN